MSITYEEFKNKQAFTKQELLAHAWGSLISDLPPEGCGMLPAPPMLMLDRVTELTHSGNKGRIVGEQDIALSDWFFQCHFRKDPVQPGCLGVDAIWQLLGFYAVVRGAKGTGRALGCKEVEFFGQIRPHNKVVRYEVTIRRYSESKARGAAMVIGSALVIVDEEPIYKISEAKVGIFTDITYEGYPFKTENSVGGVMVREEQET
jgi:3-hydroxyacyl-[acyl-carrier protein] dehydratase/trans-2-decenoyl-[acyl-carrier protein] isomerase